MNSPGEMIKNKLSISLLTIFLISAIFKVNIFPHIFVNESFFQYKHYSSKTLQEYKTKLLIVNCQSILYDSLCEFVSSFLTKKEIPHSIIKRNHDNLQDIVNSQFEGFDLLIISGSSTFLPDSPEVQDVSTLLKIIMKQDKYAFVVCFGLQLLAFLLDSKDGKLVKKGSWDKDVSIDILIDDSVFQNIGSEGVSFITKQYHNYSVPFSGKENLGKGRILAKSKDGIEIIRTGKIVATQFHPESRYASPQAKCVLQNYLKAFISNF